MCIMATCADPTSPGVWWRDDADWKPYDAAQAATIQRAFAAGAMKVELGNVVSSKHAGGARYVVDLVTMKQINLASGFERDVKILKPAAAPATSAAAVNDTVMKELEACKKTILSLKNIVHKLNVDVLAMKLQIAKNNAKRAGVNRVAITGPKSCFAPGFAPRRCAARDPKCEDVRCDMRTDSWIDEFEDDPLFSDDDLLFSDDDLLSSGSFEVILPEY